jgi:hypothetical protein
MGRRTRLARLVVLLLALTLAPALDAATRANHVRIVLDISKSMGFGNRPGNDPGRLAVLATMLLYDLVDPNPQRPEHPDSLVVLPFKHNWPRWTDPSRPPPTGTGTPIRATAQDSEARDAFWRELRALVYQGEWTYFHPGLRAALDSIASASTDPDDRRIIVLVTDGLPETEVKGREAELLQELRTEMLGSNVELYVLAFGPAASQERAFFDAIFPGDDHDPLGSLFVDPSGKDLVLNMALLFSRSFGFVPERLGVGPRSRALDLDGDITPPKVAVIALHRGSGAEPSQSIVPWVTAPRGETKARERGAAYSVQMIEGVDPQAQYRLDTGIEGADVAILRQVRPDLSLVPGYVERDGARQGMSQGRRVVAETPFALRVLAQSPTGTDGDQADLNISFRRLGPRKDGCSFEWKDDFQGSVQGSRSRFGQGVTYDIRMEFPKNPRAPGEIYQAFVEAKAEHNGTEVGELGCGKAREAHELEVWPKIAIRTLPPDGFLDPSTLRKEQSGCARFALEMDDPSRLDVLGTDRLRLRAYAVPQNPGMRQGVLANAQLKLDGETLGLDPVGETPWHAGREHSRDALLGPHDLCVTLGDPRIEAATEDLGLMLHLSLDHTPYNDFDVVQPFAARFRVLPTRLPLPGSFAWDTLWPLLLPLVAALAALWLVAPRRPLPDDLGFLVRAEPDPAGHPGAGPRPLDSPPLENTLKRLPPPSLASRLLGRSPPRPIPDPDSPQRLAWVVPLGPELYGLRPARGLAIREGEDRPLAGADGIAPIEVHRDYTLVGKRGRWRLRLGYCRERGKDGRSEAALRPPAAEN